MAVSLSDYLARTNPGGAGDLSTNYGAFLDSVNYGDIVAYTPKAHYAPNLSEQWMPSWDGGGGNVWMSDDTGYQGQTDALTAALQAAGDRTWADYDAANDALMTGAGSAQAPLPPGEATGTREPQEHTRLRTALSILSRRPHEGQPM